MRKSAKIIIGAVIVVALGAFIVFRFVEPKKPSEAVAPPVVRVENLLKDTIELSTGMVGKIESSDMVYIVPKMGGEVTEVLVKAGDVVTKGQLLCKIDTKQVEGAKLSMDAAAITLSDAKANLARMQVLYNSGDISAQAFEQVQSGVKSAQIQYDGAKLAYDTQLESSNITAPISGVVESADMEVHDLVSQQNLICVISGEAGKSISFAVTEGVAAQLSEGVEIRVEKNDVEYTGTITQASTMADPATGLFKMKAAVAGADALVTGTSAKLYVTSAKAENADTLPVDAIYYEDGNAFVYTYENGKAHKVSVTTGISSEERIEITSGLTADHQVITTWSPELDEDAPVELLREPAEAESTVTQEGQAESTATQTGAAESEAAPETQQAQ